MNKVIEYFSCNDWLLAHTEDVSHLIEKFDIKLVDTGKTWEQAAAISLEQEQISAANFADFDLQKIVISSPVSGYQVIEGKAIGKFYIAFGKAMARDSEVYKFSVDIWVPWMGFSYFKNGELLRTCEYNLDEEGEAIEIAESGEMLPFEKVDLQVPQPENGYDDFYYPLAIMEYLGVTSEDLEKSLSAPCSIYKIMSFDKISI